MENASSTCLPVLDEWCALHCGRTDLVADRGACKPYAISEHDAPTSCGLFGGHPVHSNLRQILRNCMTNQDKVRRPDPYTCNLSMPTVAEGAGLVARVHMSFAFIVRDGGEFLERNLWCLADLGASFARWRLFYVENDSEDDTRRLLDSFAARFPPGQVVGEQLDGISAKSSAFLCPAARKAMNCEERSSLLATLRERLLARVLRSRPSPADSASQAGAVLLMLDIDFVAFSKPLYLRAFALAHQHRAAAFFASSVFKNSRSVLAPCTYSVCNTPQHTALHSAPGACIWE